MWYGTVKQDEIWLSPWLISLLVLSRCFETGMGQGLPDSVQPSIRKPFTIRLPSGGQHVMKMTGGGERMSDCRLEWLSLFVPSTLVLWNQDKKNVCSSLRNPDRCLRVWKRDLPVQVEVNYFSPGCIILPSAWVKMKHCSPQHLIVDMTSTLTCARGACETYHQVMKEKLPGLTQLLVE